MYPKFKTNLIGLAVALSFIVVGFGLGEPPSDHAPVQVPTPVLAQVEAGPALADDGAAAARPARRGALKRHMAMPYVSFAALLPRQES